MLPALATVGERRAIVAAAVGTALGCSCKEARHSSRDTAVKQRAVQHDPTQRCRGAATPSTRCIILGRACLCSIFWGGGGSTAPEGVTPKPVGCGCMWPALRLLHAMWWAGWGLVIISRPQRP